jgi:hypothetical protein
MKTHPQDRLLNAQSILFDVSTELRALAYLFETQGTKANQFAEHDMDQISHGLGLILKRQVRRLRRVRFAVEEL